MSSLSPGELSLLRTLVEARNDLWYAGELLQHANRRPATTRGQDASEEASRRLASAATKITEVRRKLAGENGGNS